MLDGTLQKAANDAVIMGPAVLINGKTELRRPGDIVDAPSLSMGSEQEQSEIVR